jgi:hypothetical protein
VIKIIIDLVFGFISKIFSGIFPGLAPPDPAAVSQANKDRADTATAELKAKVEGDDVEKNLRARFDAHPGELRKHDKFEAE